mgnify:CR=1 FL=1
MRGLALGIDVGTSGVRVCALDEHRAPWWLSAAVAMRVSRTRWRGGAVLRPTGGCAPVWLRPLCLRARRWRRRWPKRHRPLAAVRAIAVDGTSGTVLAVDEHVRPGAGPHVRLMRRPPRRRPMIAASGGAAHDRAAHWRASSALARAIGSCNRCRASPGSLHQADWVAGRLSGRFGDLPRRGRCAGERATTRWRADGRTGSRGRECSPGCCPMWMPAGTRRPGSLQLGLIAANLRAAAGRRQESSRGTTDGCAAVLARGAAGQSSDGVTSPLGSALTTEIAHGRAGVRVGVRGIYSHRIGDGWLARRRLSMAARCCRRSFPQRRLRALGGAAQIPIASDRPRLLSAGGRRRARFPIRRSRAGAAAVAPQPPEDHASSCSPGPARRHQRPSRGARLPPPARRARARRRCDPCGPSAAVPRTGLDAHPAGPARRLPSCRRAPTAAAAGAARLAWRGLGVEIAP